MRKIKNRILITGAAGFIGAALSKKLIKEGQIVIGLDNMSEYYDVELKKSRLLEINQLKEKNNINWIFNKISIEDHNLIFEIFDKFKPSIVVHLAAQAGVRYSIANPYAYFQSNLLGFGNILEACRKFKVKNLIYASSSSVYGGNLNLPYKEDQGVNHPVSLYAATKKSNELMAHSYSNLYGIPATGLRFFTVYGPWGRPDMAPMIFADSIINNKPISIFNYGDMMRDFTFIDDIIEGLFRCCFKPATSEINFNNFDPKPSTSFAPHRIFNIGNNKPIKLLDFIEHIEKALNKKAIKNYKPMQKGDVKETFADTHLLEKWINFKPSTSIDDGIKLFINWYTNFYQIKN